MDLPEQLLTTVPPVLALAAITFAIIDHRRAPEPGMGWFVVAIAAFVAGAVPFHPYGFEYDTPDNGYVWRFATAVLILLPVLVLRVVAAIGGLRSRAVIRVADAYTAFVLGWLLLMPTFPGPGYEPQPWWFTVAMLAFIVHFAVAVTISVALLARAARGASGPPRTRGRLLAVSLAMLGSAFIGWSLAPGPDLELAMSAWAFGSGIVFWLAVRAPRAMFLLLTRDPVEPGEAIGQLMRSRDVRRDLPGVLDSTIRGWGLISASVVDADGHVIEASGASRLDAPGARFARRHVEPSSTPQGVSIVIEALSLTPTLRRRDHEQLRLLATFIQLAIEREAAAEQERRAAAEAATASRTTRLANERIARAGEVADRFLSIVAEELREPAASLLGLTRMTDRTWDELPGDQLQPLQQLVARRAEHIAGTVEQLLLASSIEAGTLLRGSERVEVGRLLRAVARESDLDVPVVELTGEAANRLVETDVLAVRHVLGAFLVNAHQHGGGPVQLRGRQEHDAVVLEVVDAGPGIEPALEQHLFDRFTRDATTSARGGLGLGLAIAHELARLIGARVGYRREDGHSVFWLRLPLVDGVTAASTPR